MDVSVGAVVVVVVAALFGAVLARRNDRHSWLRSERLSVYSAQMRTIFLISQGQAPEESKEERQRLWFRHVLIAPSVVQVYYQRYEDLVIRCYLEGSLKKNEEDIRSAEIRALAIMRWSLRLDTVFTYFYLWRNKNLFEDVGGLHVNKKS